MVQEFNVVRCFSCEAFQVEQVKKSTNKWSCKLCHEKQSLKQIYFRGAGKDCRLNCQELNMKRHEKDKEIIQKFEDEEEDGSDMVKDWLPLNTENTCPANAATQSENNGGSKWFRFLEKKQEDDDEDNESSSLAINFRGEANNPRKRKNTTSSTSYSEKSTKFKSNSNGTNSYSDVYTNRSTKELNTNENKKPTILGNSQIYQARVPSVPYKEEEKKNNSTNVSNINDSNEKQNIVETKWSKFLSAEEEGEDFSDDENTCMLKT